MSKRSMGINVFVIYSHKDEKLKQMLEVHLTILKRQGYISGWFNNKISTGKNRYEHFPEEIETPGIILMLVSPGLLDSGYFRNPGFEKVLDLYRQGKAKVIPVILEECDWREKITLPGLPVLPDNGKAVADYISWYSFDEAFTNVLKGLKKIIRPGRDKVQASAVELNVPTRLRNGSKKYYEALRGPNGRFRFLRISDIILPSTRLHWLETPISMPEPQGSRTPDEPGQVFFTLLENLPLLWQQEVKHAIAVGEGGMGKTVSLLRWWEQLLEPGEPPKPVPVFIALNEFNQVPEGKRKDFIIDSVLRNYGGEDREPLTAAEVKNTMKTPLTAGSEFVPSIVLLLDGFNEITADKRELLLELNHLVEQCPGIQVVITSRYDMRGNFNWGHWNLIRLRELEEKKVELYLQGKGLAVPGQGRLRQLLGNPMMLTLFAASSELLEKYRDSRYCAFKETVETPGELLWNFIEAQVAILPERVGLDESQVVYYWFLLKYVLPGLGYEMEKQGVLAFTNVQFRESLDRLYRRFGQEDFLTTFPQIGEYIKILPVGKLSDTRKRLERTTRLRNIFCHDLHMLVEEGETLRFHHQEFRDFFTAVHALNEAEISLSKGQIPGVFKERIMAYFVRRLLGEIEGEHRSKPYLAANEGWMIDINKENRLHQVLDLCRGKFGEDVGFAVWNIVTIWKEVRGELSGVDLSRLDLSGVVLNGVSCSRFYRGNYLAACFDGARVGERNLLFWGHSLPVKMAIYSPDGQKILSASYDNTIKEWDAAAGECLKTLVGHSFHVSSAVYSPDGKKILSASGDKTIKEWDAATGECLKTLGKHSDGVNSALYSRDGKKILSASDDKTIKEWDAATGECVKTLAGHLDRVSSAVYSPDGKKILSTSRDYNIKEWDAAAGECVQTLAGHSDSVDSAVYSPDGKKILSASDDKTIKEWDAAAGKCLKTLPGRYTAVYSQGGEKILSASVGATIKEWEVSTGECVQTLAGHLSAVYSAVYSPDGKKILSASDDKTIKEWDAATGECVQTLDGHSTAVISTAFSPDRKKILSACLDHTIKEWDAVTGECLQILVGHSARVSSVVYSRDGKKILSAADDQTIKEWDATTGACLETWERDKKSIPHEYAPDQNKNKKLIIRIDYNKIYFNGKEIVNIPGLFIQGCSFKDLEPGSIISPDNLEILRQYGGRFK